MTSTRAASACATMPSSGCRRPRSILGKDKPFALEPKELQDVKKFLISKKPIIRTFWSSFADVVTLMKNGDIWATAGWLPIYWVLKQTEKMNVQISSAEGRCAGLGRLLRDSQGDQIGRGGAQVHQLDVVRRLGNADRARQGLLFDRFAGRAWPAAEIKQALNMDNLDGLMKRLKWSGFRPNLQEWTEAWTEFKAA